MAFVRSVARSPSMLPGEMVSTSKVSVPAHWREIQENIVEVRGRRSMELEAAIGDLLLEPRLPLAEVSRHHSMTPFKILPGLPPYGLSALPFPEDGQGSFSEGLVVKISPSNKDAWVGNFHRGLSGPDIVLEHPDQRHMIVIAGGQGYIIDPETAKQTHQLSDLIKHAIPVPELGAVVLGDDLQFESIRAEGLWWKSGRISWDGFRNIAVSGIILTGESYSAVDQEWSPFVLDLTSGASTGGSYAADMKR